MLFASSEHIGGTLSSRETARRRFEKVVDLFVVDFGVGHPDGVLVGVTHVDDLKCRSCLAPLDTPDRTPVERLTIVVLGLFIERVAENVIDETLPGSQRLPTGRNMNIMVSRSTSKANRYLQAWQKDRDRASLQLLHLESVTSEHWGSILPRQGGPVVPTQSSSCLSFAHRSTQRRGKE